MTIVERRSPPRPPRGRPGSDRSLSDTVDRLRRFARPLGQRAAGPPVPPPLPPGRSVQVPGRGEMFIREAPAPPGSPVILLLHGWTATADLNFFPIYETLAGLGHLVAVDHRGHGRGLRSAETFSLEAAADDAAALLRHLGLGPAVVMGYSMGGPISMLVWQRHRDVVDGLVLAATALEWRASRRERATFRIMRRLEVLFRLGPPRNLLERYLRACIEECPELEPWRGWLLGEYRRGDGIEVAAAGQALSCYDGRPFAGQIDVPTAVVVTIADRLVRPKKQRALAQTVPGAMTFELDGDHDCPLTNPGAFREAAGRAVQAVIQAVDPARLPGQAGRAS